MESQVATAEGCELYHREKYREDCTGCNEAAQDDDDDDELISEAEQEKLGEMLLGKEAFATSRGSGEPEF